MQNRAELVGVLAQNGVESVTKFRCLDFAPIMLAHCRQFVGEENSALEKIQLPVKLDAAQREKTLVKIRQAKIESPETSLLRDVMNREDG